MIEQYSRFGAPSEGPLLRIVRRLTEQSTEEGVKGVLALAADVLGVLRIMLASDSAPYERGTREVRVPIPDLNEQLVVASAEEATPVALEHLHALAATLSVTLRLIAREREAERSRYHVTLGRAVAGVVHDIANPLNVVQLSLEAARDGIDTADAVDDALGATKLIRSALDRLRKFNGILEAHPSAVDVGGAIAAALRIASFATRGVAEVVVRVSPGLSIWARAGELEHVLVNVIINAAQAISGIGGFHHRITVVASALRSDVVIEVHDTGPGVAPANLGRLFDEGFTTKAARNGSGLGLSLCREIVTKLGGSMRIESAEGQGTGVIIELPGATQTGAAEGGDRAPTSGVSRLPRVLLVDADALVTRSLVRALHRTAAVTTTTSVDDALQALATEPFDLVVCEHRPPYVDGLVVRREHARRRPDQADAVVLMIVDPAAVDLPPGTRVITKPVDIRALKTLVS